MSQKLIGRTKEVETLKAALVSNQPEFVAVVGRRRVGKTFMIKQTYESDIRFELTGLQHSKKTEQLQNFIFAIRTFFPDFEMEERPKSWLEAFFMLTTVLDEFTDPDEKKVIFLDEVPWLGTKRSGFIQGLGWFWNSWAKNKNIVLVICGSAASWMIDKVINDRGGLHNRVTQIIFLYPFSLAETEAYLRSKKIRLNRYQITQIYMSMGGIPMYLNQVKPGLSAVQNIQAICFHKSGYLRKEFDRLFSSLFENHEKHVEVIKVLFGKKMGMTRKEIVEKSRFQNGGTITKILNELNQSGFIEPYASYGKKSQNTLYRLTDPYSLFYLSFIEKLASNSKTDFTNLSDLPGYKSWSGYSFENVCFNHIDQIRKALGISGMFTSAASFFAKSTEGLPGAQIDLLIDRNDNSINICEVKFSKGLYEITKRDVQNFEAKKRVFRARTKTKKHLFFSLITTFGLIENSNKINHVDQEVTLDDLFLP